MESYTRRKFLCGIGLGVAGLAFGGCSNSKVGRRPVMQPNVLFIAVDDLNDWIGSLGGHPQVKTPNIDRLVASGVLFSNAHCAAPACNPSRSAIMTGISPHKSGLYANGQKMREVMPDAELLPRYFANHGYWAGGSGKILHYSAIQRTVIYLYPL
jgi:arylsulfatase A-like enzyme